MRHVIYLYEVLYGPFKFELVFIIYYTYLNEWHAYLVCTRPRIMKLDSGCEQSAPSQTALTRQIFEPMSRNVV